MVTITYDSFLAGCYSLFVRPVYSFGRVSTTNPALLAMEPGKTYVRALPGHTRPVFVRKRRQTIGSGFGLTAIAKALGAQISLSRPTRRVEEIIHPQPQQTPGFVDVDKPTVHPRLDHLHMPYVTLLVRRASQAPTKLSQPELERAGPYVETITMQAAKGDSERQETVLRHFCSSCGKYRSPGYHSRHPFIPGHIPSSSICRRCVKKYTSSEESDRGERSQRNKKVHARRTRPLRRKWSGDETANTPSSSKEQIRIMQRLRSLSVESHKRTTSQQSSSGVVQFRSFGRTGADNTDEKNNSQRTRHVTDHPCDSAETLDTVSRSPSQVFISPLTPGSAQLVPGQSMVYGPDKPLRSRRAESFQYHDCVVRQKNCAYYTRRLSRSRSNLGRNSEATSTDKGLATQTGQGYCFQRSDNTDHQQHLSQSNNQRRGLAKSLRPEDSTWRPSKSVRVIRVTRGIEEQVERLGREARRSVGKRTLSEGDQTRLPINRYGVPHPVAGTKFDGTQRHVRKHLVEEAEDSEDYSRSGKRGRNIIRPRSETKIR